MLPPSGRKPRREKPRPRTKLVEAIVRDLPGGTVARYNGWWGVIGSWLGGRREFDRWDAPRIAVYGHEVVTVEVPYRQPADSGVRSGVQSSARETSTPALKRSGGPGEVRLRQRKQREAPARP